MKLKQHTLQLVTLLILIAMMQLTNASTRRRLPWCGTTDDPPMTNTGSGRQKVSHTTNEGTLAGGVKANVSAKASCFNRRGNTTSGNVEVNGRENKVKVKNITYQYGKAGSALVCSDFPHDQTHGEVYKKNKTLFCKRCKKCYGKKVPLIPDPSNFESDPESDPDTPLSSPDSSDERKATGYCAQYPDNKRHNKPTKNGKLCAFCWQNGEGRQSRWISRQENQLRNRRKRKKRQETPPDTPVQTPNQTPNTSVESSEEEDSRPDAHEYIELKCPDCKKTPRNSPADKEGCKTCGGTRKVMATLCHKCEGNGCSRFCCPSCVKMVWPKNKLEYYWKIM